MTHQATYDKFVADTRACLIKAVQMFGVDIDPLRVVIRLDIRGQNAGYAGRRNGIYFMRFNPVAIVNFNDEMTNDTIPHEVAHIICFANPRLGKDHDAGWKRVCRALGGDDSRTHEMMLEKVRHKTIWRYEYVVGGEVVMVGPKHHKKIQATHPSLSTICTRRTRTTITRDHYVRAFADGQPVTSDPTKMAARAPRPTTTASKSKVQLAEEIVAANPTATRAQIIGLFMNELNMSKAGASTYYYNIKNKK